MVRLGRAHYFNLSFLATCFLFLLFFSYWMQKWHSLLGTVLFGIYQLLNKLQIRQIIWHVLLLIHLFVVLQILHLQAILYLPHIQILNTFLLQYLLKPLKLLYLCIPWLQYILFNGPTMPLLHWNWRRRLRYKLLMIILDRTVINGGVDGLVIGHGHAV